MLQKPLQVRGELLPRAHRIDHEQELPALACGFYRTSKVGFGDCKNEIYNFYRPVKSRTQPQCGNPAKDRVLYDSAGLIQVLYRSTGNVG